MKFLYYVKKKIELCENIYILLSSIAKNNHENELQLFSLIPFFQLHAKYLPSAINCMINIITNN